jgi:hypothetical protein
MASVIFPVPVVVGAKVTVPVVALLVINHPEARFNVGAVLDEDPSVMVLEAFKLILKVILDQVGLEDSPNAEFISAPPLVQDLSKTTGLDIGTPDEPPPPQVVFQFPAVESAVLLYQYLVCPQLIVERAKNKISNAVFKRK